MSEEKFLNETKQSEETLLMKRQERKKNKRRRWKKKKIEEEAKFEVSGRDDTLLKLLAQKMNFKYKYIDVKMIEMDGNVTMADALGLQMLQKRVISLL